MDVGTTFAALADDSRRQMLTMLGDGEGATATELARDLPISRQAVSKHLAALRTAGLVSARHQGRETRYTVTPEPLQQAVAWIADTGAAWDQRLARLGGYVRQERSAG